ncbi:MAG: single-stranded DNA-binding protein [Spirochaetales bacterium]
MPRKNRFSDLSGRFTPAPYQQLNSIWLEGTVLGEPEVGESSGLEGCRAVYRFEVATSRWQVQDQEVSVFAVEVSEPKEELRRALTRGRGVRILGRLHQTRWTDQAGRPHNEVHIVGNSVEPRPKLQ